MTVFKKHFTVGPILWSPSLPELVLQKCRVFSGRAKAGLWTYASVCYRKWAGKAVDPKASVGASRLVVETSLDAKGMFQGGLGQKGVGKGWISTVLVCVKSYPLFPKIPLFSHWAYISTSIVMGVGNLEILEFHTVKRTYKLKSL